MNRDRESFSALALDYLYQSGSLYKVYVPWFCACPTFVCAILGRRVAGQGGIVRLFITVNNVTQQNGTRLIPIRTHRHSEISPLRLIDIWTQIFRTHCMKLLWL